MAGKGKVSLSFDSPGEEQPRRHSFTDSQDFVWDKNSRDLFGKDVEEEEGGGEEKEDHAGGFAWGLVGSQTSNPFSNYYDAGHVSRKRWSPKKTSNGTALARKVRGIRSSPKPVTSLESCLRAHITTHRLICRPLYFSSTVAEEGGLEVDSENSSEVPRQTALPNLPNLSKSVKEHAAKLIPVVTSKSERGSNNSESDTPSSPNDSICSKMPCFETLLFSFGVGLGVLFASGAHKVEVKRLSQLLDQTQADLEALKWEFARRNSSPASRTHRFVSATHGKVSEGQHSVRSYDYGSEQQEDQMAELEAELEAELDQLTRGDSATMDSQYSAMDELDMDVSMVFGELEPTGLPGVEEDSEEYQSPLGQQPACLNHYAVSPRELTRLLRKLQTTRQDKLIAELEEDLEAALSTLQSRDRDLELWKDRVKRLTKVSFVATSGDEYLTPRPPTEGMALVDTVSVSREEKAIEVSSANCGTVLDEGPAGLHPSSGTRLGDDAKSNLHTSVFAKQEPQDMGNYSQAEVIAREVCNPILDHAQIITQLIDSVHGLESWGLFSSSSSDTLDDTPEKLGGDHSLPRAKLVGQLHPYNSDVGNSSVLVRKKLENENPPSLDADPDGRYKSTGAMESSKSFSDMSSDADCCRTTTTETPCSVKYMDSTTVRRPAARVSPDTSLWVGRAGLTTPVKKVRQQFGQQLWSGQQSPTVLEKIARWEGLIEGEMPGPATGSDWECQSRDDVGNVFSEENLGLEAEEMLIKRIVEKSRLGSDSLVKKAQSALATLERDDGVEVDAYHGDDTFANERTDSDDLEAGFSERSDDDYEKQQPTSVLGEPVCKEYEFFRRLEIISKDRKAMKSTKEKATRELPDLPAGGVNQFVTIPELKMGFQNHAQRSPVTQPFGITEVLRKDVEVQPDDPDKENNMKQLVEPNIRGRENWLSRPATFRPRSGCREDEVPGEVRSRWWS